MSRTLQCGLVLAVGVVGCGDGEGSTGATVTRGSVDGTGATTATAPGDDVGGSSGSEGAADWMPEDNTSEASDPDTVSSGQRGEDCELGWLDCDDEPGCESSAAAATTCGLCDKSCVVGVTELTCSNGMCSGELTLTEVEEVSTREPGSATNYNDQPILWVTGARLNNEHAYIRFAGVDALPAGATVHEAVLLLDRPVPLPSVQPIEFSVVSGDWTDDTLTWGTEPPFQAPFATVMVGEENPLRVDIVPAVEEWVAGVPNHGVVLVSALELDPLDSDNVRFYGSEVVQWGLDGIPPRLELTLAY